MSNTDFTCGGPGRTTLLAVLVFTPPPTSPFLSSHSIQVSRSPLIYGLEDTYSTVAATELSLPHSLPPCLKLVPLGRKTLRVIAQNFSYIVLSLHTFFKSHDWLPWVYDIRTNLFLKAAASIGCSPAQGHFFCYQFMGIKIRYLTPTSSNMPCGTTTHRLHDTSCTVWKLLRYAA
jgi:hypothetical protein